MTINFPSNSMYNGAMNYLKIIQRSNIKINIGAALIALGLLAFVVGAITMFFNAGIGLSILAAGLLGCYLGTAFVQDAEAALRLLMDKPKHLL
jgi:hypothetical protein